MLKVAESAPSSSELRYARESFVRIEDIAERLRIPESVIERWLLEKRLIHFRIGNERLITETDLDSFLKAYRVEKK